jgi:hypothetical protein
MGGREGGGGGTGVKVEECGPNNTYYTNWIGWLSKKKIGFVAPRSFSTGKLFNSNFLSMFISNNYHRM